MCCLGVLMKNPYFLSLENLQKAEQQPLDTIVEHLAFNGDGLLPVIVQDNTTRQVLMMAWMNRESLAITLDSGKMTYWSRSRQSLWIKGETSGNTQTLKQMYIDCDGDALLCHVEQNGPACHTGRSNCFYLSVDREHNSACMTASRPGHADS